MTRRGPLTSAALVLAFALLVAACSTTSEVTADDPAGITPTPAQPTEPESPGQPDDSADDAPGESPDDADAPRTVPPLRFPPSLQVPTRSMTR